MKKLTKAGNKRVAREIVNALKYISFDDFSFLDNIQILYNGEIHSYRKGEEINVAKGKASDYCEYANDDTVTLIYDGGPLWSVMNNEFGYTLEDEFLTQLKSTFNEYGIYLESCTSWCSTIAR